MEEIFFLKGMGTLLAIGMFIELVVIIRLTKEKKQYRHKQEPTKEL